MGTKQTKAQERAEAEERILFPYEDVELVSGEKVVVRAWTIDDGPVQLARLLRIMELVAATAKHGVDHIDWDNRDAVLAIALPYTRELRAIARDSIGMDEATFRSRVVLIEDLLRILVAVWTVNVARADGGGVLVNLRRLVSGKAVSVLMGLNNPA